MLSCQKVTTTLILSACLSPQDFVQWITAYTYGNVKIQLCFEVNNIYLHMKGSGSFHYPLLQVEECIYYSKPNIILNDLIHIYQQKWAEFFFLLFRSFMIQNWSAWVTTNIVPLFECLKYQSFGINHHIDGKKSRCICFLAVPPSLSWKLTTDATPVICFFCLFFHSSILVLQFRPWGGAVVSGQN